MKTAVSLKTVETKVSFWDTGKNISLTLTGGLQIRRHLSVAVENTNDGLLSFCYSAYYLHLSILLRFTLIYCRERAGGQFRCNIKTRRHTLPRSRFPLATQTTHTYAAHSPRMHQHSDARPQAAGSEVIMRARSICSLTPAVCLDYGNVNRSGLTASHHGVWRNSQQSVSQANAGNTTWRQHSQISRSTGNMKGAE